MEEIDNKDLLKALDEHLKRLHERYKNYTKMFTATHIGHIALSVFFVVSILFPYLYLQIDGHQTDAQYAQLSLNISRQEQNAAVYHQAIAGLKRVFEAVENIPKPLENYIHLLRKEAAGGPVALLPDGLTADKELCGPPIDKDAWMECRIRTYMAARVDQYQNVLAQEFAAPLEQLNIKEFDQWRKDLRVGIKRHIERIKSEMAANPKFWRDFNQNSPIYLNMVQAVQRFWMEHQFEEIGRRMEQVASLGQTEIEQLNQKKAKIKKDWESLNNTLKDIKTRFGKIGLEIDEAILLAPVFFAILFLIVTHNLCQSIQLRKSFHRLFQARDPQKTVLTDAEIALAMPLWVDPLATPVQRKIKLTVLLIPALASVLTWLVIIYCWSALGTFAELTAVDTARYLIYYLLAAGIFIFGFERIRNVVKKYNTSPTMTGP